ncbi:hypothetical protein BCD_1139 (plasmid) [Borrelia crocidurae DOU]|uniref:Variable outer membrane protein n=1 Tax=Borrelia crocidurae DOU TaxID=1293575 RepID=W5SJX1_9SPIR|nr:hypothetical protein BCD_1139 [Borrelia crocidurae DOU]
MLYTFIFCLFAFLLEKNKNKEAKKMKIEEIKGRREIERGRERGDIKRMKRIVKGIMVMVVMVVMGCNSGGVAGGEGGAGGDGRGAKSLSEVLLEVGRSAGGCILFIFRVSVREFGI